MSMFSDCFKLSQAVQAPPAEAFRAFTNSMALREWLCDYASFEPRPGGRAYLWWNSGFFSSGEVAQIEPGRSVIFTWRGRNDPDKTTVQVNFIRQNGGTLVSLEHEGCAMTDDWNRAREDIKRGWEKGFENLASVLDTGIDLRIVNRPMMGVLFGDFNPEKAKELKVPAQQGMRLDQVIEGMGAYTSGLKKNDVIVEMDGKPTPDWPAIISILQRHRGGDTVQVKLFRGAEKLDIPLLLSRRPIPEIPPNTILLAEMIREENKRSAAALEECFTDITEAQSEARPAPGEWNCKEILAHLIHSEVETQVWIQELVFAQERVADGFIENLDARIQATLMVLPTVRDLLGALFRAQIETSALLTALPVEFSQHKGTLWRLGYTLLQPPGHLDDHIAQIQANLRSFKSVH